MTEPKQVINTYGFTPEGAIKFILAYRKAKEMVCNSKK